MRAESRAADDAGTYSDHGGQGSAALNFVVSAERGYRKWQVQAGFFYSLEGGRIYSTSTVLFKLP